ncbi:MAG: CPBP family intramembrane metalloprotease [Bacteroidales bacterium]|jgi:membrane protease YdiL (CAAX protease family)|nr:CPBP family intramembrane metalloprotease [Bacteroidales bacterium]
MQKGLFEGKTPFVQLIFTAFAMITCCLLLMFVGMLFIPLVEDVSLSDILTGKVNMVEHLPIMRYLQVLQGFTLFIIPALFLGFLFSGNVIRHFSFHKTGPKTWFLYVFFIMLAIVPLINLLASLNEMIVFPKSLAAWETKFRALEDNAAKAMELFMNMKNINDLLFNVFMIALIPAIGEELMFRGVIQKICVRWTGNVHVGIIIAAFLFSAMHMQFYGFFPRWLLGILLGYLLVWSKSIWLPIFAHFINNAMAVVVEYLSRKNIVDDGLSDYGSTMDAIPITIIFTAVCGLLLLKIHREKRAIAGEFTYDNP